VITRRCCRWRRTRSVLVLALPVGLGPRSPITRKLRYSVNIPPFFEKCFSSPHSGLWLEMTLMDAHLIYVSTR
jgi:hypothetical protein